MKVSLFEYCDWNTKAIGVSIGFLDLYFSYDTIIAFRFPGYGLVVRENDWSTTTGRHLNSIPHYKTERISGEQFEISLSEVLEKINFQQETEEK